MNRIKELRIEKNIKQKELADILNISQQAISTYENNTREPDADSLKKLAEFFNCSVDYLIGITDIREPAEKILKDSKSTVALHRTDGYDEDLPEEARREIENFKEFIRMKYGKK